MPCLDRADVLPRDHAADDLVLEHEAAARLARLDVDDHVPVLATATRLANEPALDLLRAVPDRLAIRHLRTADVGLHAELPAQPVDDDLQVQLAHAGDDRLCPSPGRCARGTSGPRRPAWPGRCASLSWSALVFGSMATSITGSGNFIASRMMGVRLDAQRVARLHVLEPDGRRDVAGEHLFPLLALVRVHLQDAAHALALVLRRVVGRSCPRAASPSRPGRT